MASVRNENNLKPWMKLISNNIHLHTNSNSWLATIQHFFHHIIVTILRVGCGALDYQILVPFDQSSLLLARRFRTLLFCKQIFTKKKYKKLASAKIYFFILKTNKPSVCVQYMPSNGYDVLIVVNTTFIPPNYSKLFYKKNVSIWEVQ